MDTNDITAETREVVSTLINSYIEVEHPQILSYISMLESLIKNDNNNPHTNNNGVVQEFLYFKDKMIEHIEIEENIIFPKIIRVCRMNYLKLNSCARTLYKKQLIEWLSFHKLVN